MTNRSAFPELSDTEYHSLLSSKRRRATLVALADQEHPVDLTDLAVAVGAHETNTPASEVAVDDLVVLSLHHHHLPKMNDLGVLDYDPKTKRVR
ncbi:hypothetical protein D3D01_21305 [Haloarcula sp. Atlit-7R]|nr:hypothetical protein D3D01_21305 [Haloarcula sp. Atlit-7R]